MDTKINKYKLKEILSFKLGKCIDGNTGELYFKCPFCVGEKTGNKRYVFGVNVNKSVYGCVRCNESGNLKGLCRDLGINLNGSISTKNNGIDIVNCQDEIIDIKYESFKDNPKAKYMIEYQYAEERNFLDVECGTSVEHPYYVIFPIFNNEGDLVYYQGRIALKGDYKKKKNVNPRHKKPSILYTPYGYSNELILVEGVADAITVKGHGILGSELTKGQIKFIHRLINDGVVNKITVWLDGDAIHKAIKIIREFILINSVSLFLIDWTLLTNFSECDPDNINSEERKILYDKKIYIKNINELVTLQEVYDGLSW